MHKKTLSLIATAACLTLLFASAGFANIPAPPVNQTIGFADTTLGGAEADCRTCHDVTPPENVDAHHVLYGQDLADPTVVPYNDGDTIYGCIDCHSDAFIVTRDCMVCHIELPHHTTAAATGGDCVSCHGTNVDNIGDHTPPTYTPSLVTPEPGNKYCEDTPLQGCTENDDCDTSDCIGATPGSCSFCHDAGTDTGTDLVSTDDDTIVDTNKNLHHNTGLDIGNCTWCHQNDSPPNDALDIRTCEGCHGYESLHNIQADSNGGGIVVGGEDYGYGHVGADNPGDGSDCWGCHGFSFASSSAPGAGPITPTISSADPAVIPAGINSAVTLTGSAFTNVAGETEYTSVVVLTAADDSEITLTPDAITEESMTVTIPATTAPGNYDLRAVKDDSASGPVSITINLQAAITNVTCYKCLSSMVITGANFGERPEGSEDYYFVREGDTELNIISWTDTEIQASGASCNGMVTVESFNGTATYQQQ